MKSSPRSPQLEKTHAQQRRPNAAKSLKKKKAFLNKVGPCEVNYMCHLGYSAQLFGQTPF